MNSTWLRFLTLGLVATALAFGGCGSGSDGADGMDGMDGEPGPTVINASQVTDEFLESLDVVGEVVSVEVASPPVVTFTLATSTGVPIIGIVPFWEDSSRYIRFTMCKLVPGEGTAPNAWVAYTRDADTNAPDYDTGSALVDNMDGSYTFTLNTDVTMVPGVLWEPTLTHRVAGQLGSSSVPITPQNFVYDYVPAGGSITETRNIAVMSSCNECHDDLVFHGRRFKVEYCIACHNPDLAEGEGDMAYMTHFIHAAGTFDLLDDGFDASHVTYPGNLQDCRKCHNVEDADTPDGDGWYMVPSAGACFGCHNALEEDYSHSAGEQPDTACFGCHGPTGPYPVIEAHATTNSTPNNPQLPDGQPNITYELIDAMTAPLSMPALHAIITDEVVVQFKILDDGVPIDVSNLVPTPGGLAYGPTLLLAWAEEQDGIAEPADFNNLGNRLAQPHGVSLASLASGENGLLTYEASTGIHTAVIQNPDYLFPPQATMRAVGLQGYFAWDLNGNGSYDRATETGLHTLSYVVPVDDDDERRMVIDSMKCANCHEWFEGHGGNRVGGLLPGEVEDNGSIQICMLCHVPNLSSSGRTVTTQTDMDNVRDSVQDGIDHGEWTLDDIPDYFLWGGPGAMDPNDPLTYPEDAQNMKDMIHGIHSSAIRTRNYQHIRGPTRESYYDWDHITFPRGASTSNCTLCHTQVPVGRDMVWTYILPLPANVLATTVRTTLAEDGNDDAMSVQEAFDLVPNGTDWINTATSSSCFYCHTSPDAMAHMVQNGALLSLPYPDVEEGLYRWRSDLTDGPITYESCTVCHGPGAAADVEAVHNK